MGRPMLEYSKQGVWHFMKMSKLAMAAYQSPLTFYLKVNEWEVF